MAFNIKNNESLIYGVDSNSCGGYIVGAHVRSNADPSHSPYNTTTPASIVINSLQARPTFAQLPVSSDPAFQQTNSSFPHTYVQSESCGDSNASRNILVDPYIKTEVEDSQYTCATPVTVREAETRTSLPPLSNHHYQINPGITQFFSVESSHTNRYSQRHYHGVSESENPESVHAQNGKALSQLNEGFVAETLNKITWLANYSRHSQTLDQMDVDSRMETNDSSASELVKPDTKSIGSLKDLKTTSVRHKDESAVMAAQTEDEVDGKFGCAQCAYRGQSAAILKVHQRTHSGERPFQCHLCDYRAGQKYNVTKHILVHMNEKPFKCQFCQYRCAQKNNLIVHERTHTGVKPFVCTYCEYKTVQKPNLVKHMYLHTNEKPYACEFCDYRCVQQTNLKKHVQKHSNDSGAVSTTRVPHNTKRFSCSMCPYKCAYKLSLMKHQQTKHTLALARLNQQNDSSQSPQEDVLSIHQHSASAAEDNKPEVDLDPLQNDNGLSNSAKSYVKSHHEANI